MSDNPSFVLKVDTVEFEQGPYVHQICRHPPYNGTLGRYYAVPSDLAYALTSQLTFVGNQC